MRELQEFCVLSFATTAAALTFERFCRQSDIPGRIIPLPEEISAGCGLAWRMLPAEWEEHRAAIEVAEISYEAVQEVKQWVFSRAEVS